MLKRILRVLARSQTNCTPSRAFPISPLELQLAFDRLMPSHVPTLFVHSSLSSSGIISGGPATVVAGLKSKCATLVVPTHTYCYPKSQQDIGPTYDRTRTPSVVGAISNWFWQQPEAVRSLHPTHSVAAIGPDASCICNGHETTDTPCGAGTPYEKLIERESSVLMFGCTMNTYTLFHTSEHFAQCPYLYYPTQVNLQYLNDLGRRYQ